MFFHIKIIFEIYADDSDSTIYTSNIMKIEAGQRVWWQKENVTKKKQGKNRKKGSRDEGEKIRCAAVIWSV